MIYKWLFPERENSQGSTEPIVEHEFISPGTKKVILTAEDGNGLLNTVEKEFFVAIENLPPKPKIVTPTIYGNIETQFYLDVRESRDDRIATSKLLYRWDFDGDGSWDTGKNSETVIHHQYPSPGIYKCIMEAEDDEGLSDTTSVEFQVSEYTYPTSYIHDKRDGKFYGTVKIGDHWWMSENLDYRIDQKIGQELIQKCYKNEEVNCDKFGALYTIFYSMEFIEEGHSICPDSWHIPSKEEMDDLINNIESPNGMDALRPFGSSGFNALFSGYVLYDFLYDEFNNIVKPVFRYKGYNFATYFLTTSYLANRSPPTVYTLQIQENYAELYPINTDMEGFYSLRCVKDGVRPDF